MRKSTGEFLFGTGTRYKVLEALYAKGLSDKGIAARALAREAVVPYGSIAKTLSELVSAGLVLRETSSLGPTYRAPFDDPELTGLFALFKPMLRRAPAVPPDSQFEALLRAESVVRVVRQALTEAELLEHFQVIHSGRMVGSRSASEIVLQEDAPRAVHRRFFREFWSALHESDAKLRQGTPEVIVFSCGSREVFVHACGVIARAVHELKVDLKILDSRWFTDWKDRLSDGQAVLKPRFRVALYLRADEQFRADGWLKRGFAGFLLTNDPRADRMIFQREVQHYGERISRGCQPTEFGFTVNYSDRPSAERVMNDLYIGCGIEYVTEGRRPEVTVSIRFPDAVGAVT